MQNLCQISWNTSCTHQNIYVLSEDRQEMKPKHFGVIINKNIVQQVGIKDYTRNFVKRKMYNIKPIKVIR